MSAVDYKAITHVTMVTVADAVWQLIDSVGGVRKAVGMQSRGDYLPDLSTPFDSLNLSGTSTFVMQKPKTDQLLREYSHSVMMRHCH